MSYGVTPLLWTGGLDSTFRLLQLVWDMERVVQPYYLIDPDRPSLNYELKAIYQIRRAIVAERPLADTLILPIQFRALNDLPRNETISAQYQRMAAHWEIGIQYEWLAWLAAAEHLTGIELCLQDSPNGMSAWQTELYKNCVPVSAHKADGYQLPESPKPPELAMFSRFHFPVIDYDKPHMLSWATAQGCAHIMSLTWFCHRPRRNDAPCGLCTPCRIAMKDGITYRLPLSSKLRYKAKRFFHRWQRKAGKWNAG